VAEVINNGRKKEEGRRNKEEGRRKKEEGKNRTGTILAVAVI
jgi:hypothetical protein